VRSCALVMVIVSAPKLVLLLWRRLRSVYECLLLVQSALSLWTGPAAFRRADASLPEQPASFGPHERATPARSELESFHDRPASGSRDQGSPADRAVRDHCRQISRSDSRDGVFIWLRAIPDFGT
jgi:hypothetical protein